jgi:hypothetical protein
MGMFVYDYGAAQGVRAEAGTVENEFAWGRRELEIVSSALVSGATVDAGSTPTTVLRPGLILGLITATNKWTHYSPTATDGSQVARGILAGPQLRTLDINGAQQDKHVPVIVGGPVQAAKLFGLDTQARACMYNRFIFDDDVIGNSYGWNNTVAKTAAYQVVAADNNTLFTTTGAVAEVDFTLPAAPVKGLRFRFYNTAGQTLKVIAAADKLVAFNNAAATRVAFATAGNLIGGVFEIVADEISAKWLASNLSAGANTVTVA